jgi:HD-like signal output (HDOD) protein
VATLAYQIARERRVVDPDAALLAGLLHNIGKLGLLVGLPQAPATLQVAPARERLLETWHARIGLSLVLHWQFSAEICDAIAGQDDLDLLREGPPGLGDVLAAAVVAGRESRDWRLAAATLAECHRFGMDAEQWLELIEGARLESAAVRVAFGE